LKYGGGLMNSLEFVNEKINWAISKIKEYEERLSEFKGRKERNFYYIVYRDILNNYKEELQALQQIKTELEAWELVKTHEFEIDRLDSLAEYWVVHIWKPFKPEQINKIKKALEVNE
jgi:hypothetical protein